MLPVAYGNCTEKWNNKTDFYSHIRRLLQYSIEPSLEGWKKLVTWSTLNIKMEVGTATQVWRFWHTGLKLKAWKKTFYRSAWSAANCLIFQSFVFQLFEGTELCQHSLEWNLSSGEVSSSSSLLLSSPSPLIIRFAFVDLTSCPTYLSLAIYSHEK